MRRFILWMLLFCLPLTVLAEELTELKFREYTTEGRQNFLKRMALVVWEEDYHDWPIECFDVRDDGMIALGFERPRGGNYIAVLTPDGAFQYGYAFQSTESFLLDWMDEGLGIFRLRGSVLSVFDESGECVSLKSMVTNSVYSRYKNALLKTRRTVDGVNYTLRNDHFLSQLSVNYAKLIRTDELGNETVLHDASGAALMQTVGVLGVGLFVVICIVVAWNRRQNVPKLN